MLVLKVVQAKHKVELDRLTDDLERKYWDNVSEMKETLSERHDQVLLLSILELR